MHRTQVLLEEHQYQLLKREAERAGRSMGELIREAVNAQLGINANGQLKAALDASKGAWADRNVDGAELVDQLRPGLGRRLQGLEWG